MAFRRMDSPALSGWIVHLLDTETGIPGHHSGHFVLLYFCHDWFNINLSSASLSNHPSQGYHKVVLTALCEEFTNVFDVNSKFSIYFSSSFDNS